MILVLGDSFTYGEELASPEESAWPVLLDMEAKNYGHPGASNDLMMRLLMNHTRYGHYSHVIIAWTTPNRIELPSTQSPEADVGKSKPKKCKNIGANSYRKYGKIVDDIFSDWDETWAYTKSETQMWMADAWLTQQKMPHLFVSTFDIQRIVNKYRWSGRPDCYYGFYPAEGLVEWMGDCPKGPGGHPLELGHQRIAKKINEHIRHLGWIS